MIRGVIKVVDDLNSVDPSKSDPSIPPASNGPSCCAVPIDDASDETSSASIYGNDISLVPTETLINKSRIFNNEQIAQFKGIGYELQPLVIVTGNSGKTKITFDLNAFDNADGEYTIIDISTWKEVTTFTAKQGLNDIVFSPKKIGGYAIFRDDSVLGVVEVVDTVDTVDLEKIRNTYLR